MAHDGTGGHTLSSLPCLCIYIALIRPNHWAASVAQWLEHLPSKQCVVGSNPIRAARVSCLALFYIYRSKSSMLSVLALDGC